MGDDVLWAIKNGDLESLKNTVASTGFDVVDGVLSASRKPIHYAADYGQKEVLEFLISHGAKLNEPDPYGITPLLAAIYEGHLSCVELLISKGADKTGMTPDGTSYLEAADDEQIRQLLK